MIKLITATQRHEARVSDWLRSHYLFSFADYYDPSNVQFGPLRVFNDDYIKGKAGFPMHPNSDAEILTIVLDGQITHRDNLGNEETLNTGEVQRITAGTGMTHSEMNDGDDDAHLLQLWFLTNKQGIAPSYERMKIDFLDEDNKLIPLASGQKVLEDVVFMNSNSTVYYGSLDQGEDINFPTFKIRKTLLYVLEGGVIVNGVEAEEFDHLRLEDQEVIAVHATSDASFILVDVPAVEANY